MVLVKAILVCIVAPAKYKHRELEQCELVGRTRLGSFPRLKASFPRDPETQHGVREDQIQCICKAH